MATSLVNNKYRITRRIGGGSFGEIYMGIGPNNEKVAVKFERHGTRCPQLRHEYKVYRELANAHGFCSVYHFGTQDNYNVMVMDLLGPSLEDLFNKCNRRFSLKTVLQMADQILERVDTLHSRHLIHRDIKPANFVIGLAENAANVYCVDFGLSKRYRHPKNLQHIPHRDGRSLTGTPRYASINNHLGIEQSRRDDLESIGYVLIYFLKGTLPWQGLKAKNAQKKYRLILEKKQQVSIAQLCQGCPSQFAEFLAYTRSLKFDAKPDIPYLRKLFRDLYHAQGCASVPKLWDWDGMDMDFPGSASVSGPAPVITSGGPVQQNMGLRPTTAAAVANGGLESDLLLGGGGGGGGGGGDDLEDEDGYDMLMEVGASRPNTAGVMGGGAYNQGQRAVSGNPQGVPSMQQSGAAGNWGYARQGDQLPLQLPSHQQLPNGNPGAVPLLKDPRQQPQPIPANSANAGVVDYGTDGQRRPHTAHGARAGFPNNQPPQNQPQNLQQQQQQMYAEGTADDGPMVNGTRSMIRYRRNRTSTLEPGQAAAQPINGGAVQQQFPVQQTGYGSNAKNWTNGDPAANAGSSWAVYQNNGKMQPQQQQLVQAQHPSLRKTGTATSQGTNGTPTSGWAQNSAQGYDRPKSAGIGSTTSGANNSGGGGLIASLTGAGRPSSSSQPINNGSNWNSPGGGAAVAGGNAAATNINQSSNTNTLSYGSLKNRFLSGATKNNGATTTTGQSNGMANGMVSTGAIGQPNGGNNVPVSSANSGNTNGKSSKLFSLAR